MKPVSDETRRKMSEAAKRRCDAAWREAKAESYRTQIDDEQLTRLHDEGLTQAELAAALGITQKIVWRALRRLGIKAHPMAKRNQRGSANHAWTGDAGTYQAMHSRVKRLRGQPSLCSLCGTTDPERWYDWANLTGAYECLEDYARMCRPCHRQYDARRRALTGKLTAPKSKR